MKILALDSSTDICSICITDGDRVAAEYVSRGRKTHTERLMPAIELLFSHLDWGKEQLNGIAVIHGPGSFTGLRIGLSVAKGLALGLNLPMVGMSALEVAAMQVCDHRRDHRWICPVMDARRGEIFTCLYEQVGKGTVLREEPLSIKPSEWSSVLPAAPIAFCGPGAALYRDVLLTRAGHSIEFVDFILARMLAKMASEKLNRGLGSTVHQVRAAYLRPSDAQIQGPRPARRPGQIS